MGKKCCVMTVTHVGEVEWDMKNQGDGTWRTTGIGKILSMATKEEVDGCQKLEDPGYMSVPHKKNAWPGVQKPSDDTLDYCDLTKCTTSPVRRYEGEGPLGKAKTKIMITLIQSYNMKPTSIGCLFSPGVQPELTEFETSITTEGAPKKSDLIKALQTNEEGEPTVELPKYDYNAGDNEFGYPPKTAGTANLGEAAKCNYEPKTGNFVKLDDAKKYKAEGKSNLIVNNAMSHWFYPQIDAAFPGFRDGISFLNYVIGDIKGARGWKPKGKCKGMKD
jgi:hypothetical protein